MVEEEQVLKSNKLLYLMVEKEQVIPFRTSNSEGVASPSPRDIGARRCKVMVGQEKTDKNAHISTVNIAVLPSLLDTISLSFSPNYSESSNHPSSESLTLCSLS